MRRLLTIVLLAFLLFQVTWAAIAPYCGHETRVGVEHFGHHDHKHQADAGDGVELDAQPDLGMDSTADATDGKAPGAMDLDCGHCHGTCSMMLKEQWVTVGALSEVPFSATLVEAGGAHTPTRPERPQWPPLA